MLDLPDLALQVQPEDNLMATISQAWYNGPYTMDTKPIKCSELHYTMIQLLIIIINIHVYLYTPTHPPPSLALHAPQGYHTS